jgi:MoaA/NifB/PqqE/SkfB family radical SAM enzyme
MAKEQRDKNTYTTEGDRAMLKGNPVSWIEGQVLKLGFTRNPVGSLIRSGIEKRIYSLVVERNPLNLPRKVQQDKYDVLIAILHSANRGFERGLIGSASKKSLLNVLLKQGFLKTDPCITNFHEKYGVYPPAFFAFCPTMNCNLNCKGCYAGSSTKTNVSLPFEIIDRMLTEKAELWGSHFTVVSGGEPFMYNDGDKTFIDILCSHPDQFFLVYTNGTLIDKDMARQLGEVGNATPAISIEGFEKETDDRRGKGVYKKILQAFENLREVGVPFGISTTAFRHNADLIVSQDIIDFYFDQQGAIYQWIFQYMPIGRGSTLDMMITPEQRMRMYHFNWKLIREQKRFVADFWNCGSLSDGCIAAGGGNGGGYLYIDSNGTVAPCAFNPFTTHNIKDVYKSGGDLNTVIFSPLFKEIRCWQRSYFHDRPQGEHGNMITPCPIRDHHADMRDIIDRVGARPLDKYAALALEDPSYYEGMVEYGEAIERASKDYWDKEYLEPERTMTEIVV